MSENKEEKKEESEAPKVETIPKEPEQKVPTDFKEDITTLSNLKQEGNKLIQEDLDAAIAKYEEAYNKVKEIMPKAYHEKDYNPQSSELITLERQIMSNLALGYFKKKDYNKSKEIDILLISKDPKFDKSYSRLFTAFKNLGDMHYAYYFGYQLKHNFTEETLNKYTNILPEIDEVEKQMEKERNEIIAKQRKEMIGKISKYGVPLVILIIAAFIYYFYYRKKK